MKDLLLKVEIDVQRNVRSANMWSVGVRVLLHSLRLHRSRATQTKKDEKSRGTTQFDCFTMRRSALCRRSLAHPPMPQAPRQRFNLPSLNRSQEFSHQRRPALGAARSDLHRVVFNTPPSRRYSTDTAEKPPAKDFSNAPKYGSSIR